MNLEKKIIVTKREYDEIHGYDPYIRLAQGIVKQACKDYRKAYLIYQKHHAPSALREMKDVERWVNDKIKLKDGEKMIQYSAITDMDPKILLECCKKHEICNFNLASGGKKK